MGLGFIELPTVSTRIGWLRSLWRRTIVVWRSAFGLYRGHWASLLLVGVVVLTPAAALEALADFESQKGLGDLPAHGVVLLAASSGLNLLAYQAYKGVATQVSLFWRGRRSGVPLWQVLKSLSYPTLIAVDVIVTLGTAIGLELLLIPGIVFATWYSLAPVVVELEDHKAVPAMRRSRELVRGNFAIALVILVATYFVVLGLEEGIQAVGKWALHAPADEEGVIAGTAAALLTSLIVKPISALAVIELTHELIDAERSGERTV